MKRSALLDHGRSLIDPYRVTKGGRFRLKHHDPGDTGKIDEASAGALLAAGIQALGTLQERLYADDRASALFIFQAMDAAGKDSAIKHVMTGLNPQGCQVAAFKAPSAQELDHDFLWRCQRELPEGGRIGIFNRSYYEEVVVVRVHPEFLAAQRLPAEPAGEELWEERYRQIRHFERYLTANGTHVTKFFLNVSKGEQKRRFLERIDRPEKNWKFSSGDLKERARWKEYMNAYEAMIRETASEDAPWYVVPADHKWFTRLVVAAAAVDTLARIDPQFPAVSAEKKADLAACKKALLAEK
ncbi:MAG TPA: PPK2 family polyphosphate kinase [Gemmatimonadales bacterium]|nr:PPK2 family polyphosphate kinase [Gemmatimonadales bacterium]